MIVAQISDAPIGHTFRVPVFFFFKISVHARIRCGHVLMYKRFDARELVERGRLRITDSRAAFVHDFATLSGSLLPRPMQCTRRLENRGCRVGVAAEARPCAFPRLVRSRGFFASLERGGRLAGFRHAISRVVLGIFTHDTRLSVQAALDQPSRCLCSHNRNRGGH